MNIRILETGQPCVGPILFYRGAKVVNPFYNSLKKTLSGYNIGFHVPGHNRGSIFEKLGLEIENFEKYDTTEIPGTDNLHNPLEFINECQKRASKFYNTYSSYYLVNGTTCGNYSMMMTACEPGDKIIIGRDSHRSVYNGLLLGDLKPIYLYPELNHKDHLPLGYKAEDLEKLINENPDVKAVLITRPNYYGVCSDIEAISKICKKLDVMLLVDEAHGAHFILNSKLPSSAILKGADMVVQSTHKTLPALTQSSMLHVCSDRVNEKRLKLMLQIHQSSSASYVLMNSLDKAVYIMESLGEKLMKDCLKHIEDFSKNILQIPGVKIVGNSVKGFERDITKLLISMDDLGISGIKLEELLRDEYGIQLEMSNEYYGVGVATLSNLDDDYSKLHEAIKDISINNIISPLKTKELSKYPKVESSSFSIRDAVYKSKVTIDLEESVGKICGEFIIPYPPGIPVIVPGEKISKEIVDYLCDLRNKGYNIIGMADSKCTKIDVIDSGGGL